jgi:hypothetical protein
MWARSYCTQKEKNKYRLNGLGPIGVRSTADSREIKRIIHYPARAHYLGPLRECDSSTVRATDIRESHPSNYPGLTSCYESGIIRKQRRWRDTHPDRMFRIRSPSRKYVALSCPFVHYYCSSRNPRLHFPHIGRSFSPLGTSEFRQRSARV